MNSKSKHAKRIAYYCGLSREEIIQMSDIYFVTDIGGYLAWVNRGARVLAVCHMDHLGSGAVHTCNEQVVVSSALDDRLGLYAAMEALPAMGVECDVLICDDEESANSSMASIGMQFLNKYNWVVELDCSGVRAVTYGYKSMAGALGIVYGKNVDCGAFSDITSVEHVCPVGAFNAGVGYHNQHSERCHVKISEFITAMGKVREFYDKFGDVKFVEENNIQADGTILENEASYYYYGRGGYSKKSKPKRKTFFDSDQYEEYLTRRPVDKDDPAEVMCVHDPDPFLTGDGAPINAGEGELECCEMCSRILMNDEMYFYQGFPVCEEHYFMLVADHIDGTPERADEWETCDG